MEKAFRTDSATAIDDMFNCLRNNWYKRRKLFICDTAPPISIEIIIPSKIYHRVYDDLMKNRDRIVADYNVRQDKIRIIQMPREDHLLRIVHKE